MTAIGCLSNSLISGGLNDRFELRFQPVDAIHSANFSAGVTQLGNFYESVTVRVIDNGQDYDENLNEIGRNSATKIWDGANCELTFLPLARL